MSNFNNMLINSKSGIYVTSNGNADLEILNDLVGVMYELGYVPTKKLYERLKSADNAEIISICQSLIDSNHMKANMNNILVKGFPFNKDNRPSHFELVLASYLNYLTNGQATFYVDASKKNKTVNFSAKNEMDSLSNDEVEQYLISVLESKDSIPPIAIKGICSILNESHPFHYVLTKSNVSFKEILAILNAYQFSHNKPIFKIGNGNDILRMLAIVHNIEHILNNKMTISSALEKYKIPSLSNSQRNLLVKLISSNLTLDELKINRTKWAALFHAVHIGKYEKNHPKLVEMANLVRKNQKIISFNSQLQSLKDKKAYDEASALLIDKPSLFIRNIDDLVRKSDEKQLGTVLSNLQIALSEYGNVKMMLQLLGHFKGRSEGKNVRTFTINGKAKVVTNKPLPPLNNSVIQTVESALYKAIEKAIQKNPAFEKNSKIYIGQALKKIYMPSNLRETNSKSKMLSTGSRIPLDLKDTDVLRLFLYWKQNCDVDLHGSYFDEDFKMLGSCSFYDTNGSWYQHSGDIRSAPNGAAEYIDFKLNKVPDNVRYIVLTSNVFSGIPFNKLEECFAGVMLLNKKASKNMLFDYKAVEASFDLQTDSREITLLAFDLKTNEIIWIENKGNNIVNRNYSALKSFIEYNGFSTYSLFELHVKASNAILVSSKEEADIVIDLDGDITPFDYATINSKFI